MAVVVFIPLFVKAQTGTDPYADGYKRSHPAKAIDSIYVKPDELYERLPGGSYRKARYEDVLVGRGYEDYIDKGKWVDDIRVTVLTAPTKYHTDDTVRVIHIFEDRKKKRQVFIMGPKSIRGEYINDSLAGDSVPSGTQRPWIYFGSPLVIYDGTVLQGPQTDYNFDISKYVFSKPGTYRIQWRMGKLVSNELVIRVE